MQIWLWYIFPNKYLSLTFTPKCICTDKKGTRCRLKLTKQPMHIILNYLMFKLQKPISQCIGCFVILTDFDYVSPQSARSFFRNDSTKRLPERHVMQKVSKNHMCTLKMNDILHLSKRNAFLVNDGSMRRYVMITVAIF